MDDEHIGELFKSKLLSYGVSILWALQSVSERVVDFGLHFEKLPGGLAHFEPHRKSLNGVPKKLFRKIIQGNLAKRRYRQPLGLAVGIRLIQSVVTIDRKPGIKKRSDDTFIPMLSLHSVQQKF
jgi:hypothetical protein